jgi:uncharacterized membrane protein
VQISAKTFLTLHRFFLTKRGNCDIIIIFNAIVKIYVKDSRKNKTKIAETNPSIHSAKGGIMRAKKITLLAMFTAIIFVFTFYLKIPSPLGGYLNCGDMMIFITAFLTGNSAVFPAAIGSALADIAGGYTVYVPATIVIKGVIALLAGILLRKKCDFVTLFTACLLGEVIMTGGYFVYEILVFNIGYAVGNLPFNLMQGAIGVSAAIFYAGLVRIKAALSKQENNNG